MKNLILLLLASFAFVSANANAEVGVNLFTFFGERSAEITHDDPLLLMITLENTGAAVVQQENRDKQRVLSQFKNSVAYESFSGEEREQLEQEYAITQVPQVLLGSDTLAVHDLIRFAVRNSGGETVEIDPTPLASNIINEGPIELILGDSQFYQFAVASDALSQLPGGTYYIAAVLDTSKRSDMWRGIAFSNTIRVDLTGNHSDPDWSSSDQRAMLFSSYLMETLNYVEAEGHARSWLEFHPDSIDGWAQLGESLAGQDKDNEALDALNTALIKFRDKFGDNPAELPLEILDQIDAIKARLRSAESSD